MSTAIISLSHFIRDSVKASERENKNNPLIPDSYLPQIIHAIETADTEYTVLASLIVCRSLSSKQRRTLVDLGLVPLLWKLLYSETVFVEKRVEHSIHEETIDVAARVLAMVHVLVKEDSKKGKYR